MEKQKRRYHGWDEDTFYRIEQEYEQKWLENRHLYYSSQKLNEIMKKESEQNASKSTIQS